jgi:hypothetical protein
MSFDKPKHIQKSVAAMKPLIKKVGIDMDKKLYKDMREYCLKNEITIKDIIQKAIKEYLQK